MTPSRRSSHKEIFQKYKCLFLLLTFIGQVGVQISLVRERSVVFKLDYVLGKENSAKFLYFHATFIRSHRVLEPPIAMHILYAQL